MNNKQRYKVIKKQPTSKSLYADLIRGKISKYQFPKRYRKYLLSSYIPIPTQLEKEIEVYASHFFSNIEKAYLRKLKSADREKLIKENYETI